MGNQILLWRFAIDLSLVTAVLVMAFRWMKASKAQAMLPRTLELEASLRTLIADADAAGRHLNEQLLRREQNLQKILNELQEAESRLSRLIETSEARSSDLTLATDATTELLASLNRSIKEQRALREQPQARYDEIPSREMMYQEQRQPSALAAPNTMNAAHTSARHAAPSSAQQYPPQARSDVRMSQQSQNARAPQRPSSSEPQRPRQTALQTSTKPAPQAAPGEQARKQAPYQQQMSAPEERSMQRVYAAAEALLKEGRQLEQVSIQTRLPVEEVRMLSQMIEIERDEERKKRSQEAPGAVVDSRLGVLGGIKRQTSTI